jgi:hypothetical protein
MTVNTTCPDCNTSFLIEVKNNSLLSFTSVICPTCGKEAILEDNYEEIEDETNYFVLWV